MSDIRTPEHALAELMAFGLCCPRCRGDLKNRTSSGEGLLHCAHCAIDFPVIRGIPDLRVAPDPYLGIEADRAKAQRLAAHPARTWQELAAHYYDITLDTVPRAQARRFAAGLHAAGPRASATLNGWEELASAPLALSDALLDVGCGTSPLQEVVGTRAFGRTGISVGVDVAFRWLIVGRLRLANAGVRAHLVCANAEALPFRNGVFDVCTSQATLENVGDQELTMSETRRVLASNGRYWISTANRRSIGPDPHLGIPAGGLLPGSVTAAWARSRGALPPQRQLLSLADLASLLRRYAFVQERFGVPAIVTAQHEGAGLLMSLLVRAYEFARRNALLRHLLYLLGPTLLATARASANP